MLDTEIITAKRGQKCTCGETVNRCHRLAQYAGIPMEREMYFLCRTCGRIAKMDVVTGEVFPMNRMQREELREAFKNGDQRVMPLKEYHDKIVAGMIG